MEAHILSNSIIFQRTPQELLKPQPPFLFIDAVLRFEGDTLVCSRTIREDEPYLAGHFPGNPIVPGVLLIEMANQAGALLATAMSPEPLQEGYLVRTNDFSFYHQVKPGDQLLIKSTFKERMGYYMTFKSLLVLEHSGKRAAKGEVVLYLK